LAILTKIADEEFLVDVGFGDFAIEPLKFVLDIKQTDKNGTFLIRKFDDDYFEVVKKHGDNWQSEYIFTTKSRKLSEFTEMCNFHQTSPESHFTRKKLCSILTENGRKTLTDNKFIETINGEKTEIAVESQEDFNRILREKFDLIRNY
jgi:N-hydroxyarylamine O-acetyltransferase